MIKKSKIISAVLFSTFICVLMLSSSAAAQGADPQSANIQQTIKSSIEDLGYVVDFDGDVDSWQNETFWGYKASAVNGYLFITVFNFYNEQGAIDTMGSWCSASFSSTTLHGYPACYNLNYATLLDLSTEAVYNWRAGHLFFSISLSPPEELTQSAETVYANAQKYGLLNDGTAGQDADGDGVSDDEDQCPNTSAGVAVDANGCPVAQTMNITISTDKTAYAPGDTAVISGMVSDVNGALTGVAVSVDVSGTKLSATTDASGNYHVSFPVPAGGSQVSYPATATASHAGYPNASAATTLSIQDALIVELNADADHYLIGDTVYITIVVKDTQDSGVASADLDITATRLASGNTKNLTAITDGSGERLWSFTWGQDDSGNTIAEGKLQIDVIASKNGYANGNASKTLSGCGDLDKSDIEDCLDCPEDCQCTDKEICDPSGRYKNSETFCSPKVAYVFISKGLGWYHEWWVSDDIKWIRRYYKSLGYTVPPNIYVSHIDGIAKYLSRPSTKAIAYAGHGEDPGGTPTIEVSAATSGAYPIKSAIDATSKNPGGFLYICQFETYAAKWVDSKDKIEKIAQGQIDHPNLEYAYLFSCYSLDNNSLRNYLLKSGGTFWGYKGKLPGNGTLTKSIKP